MTSPVEKMLAVAFVSLVITATPFVLIAAEHRLRGKFGPRGRAVLDFVVTVAIWAAVAWPLSLALAVLAKLRGWTP